MRRIIKSAALLLCIMLTMGTLTGCGDITDVPQDNDRLKVVCTFFPAYDFTRAITGDSAEISMLLSPGAEVHTYEPTPQDIIKIQSCDVFIYVGGESDAWVQDVLSSIDASGIKIITLMDCVETLEEEIVEGMQSEEDHEEDADEPEYDEHVWTSPRNAMLITQKISNVLCEIDPKNAIAYAANTVDYIEKLTALDTSFTELVGNAKRNTFIFADRFPLRYFTESYGLSYYAAYPGCASESEPSAAVVSFLIDKVRNEQIPAVFYIEFSNEKMADTICEETGVKKLLFHSCHNVTKEDFDAGVTYLDLMQKNLISLQQALY